MIRLEVSPPERVPWIASKTMRTLTMGRTETTVVRCVDAASLDDTKNVAICSLPATPKASKPT
jgi:hypothetical protein